MKLIGKKYFGFIVVAIAVLLTLGVDAFAQKQKTVQISATSMGTGTQMGRMINIDLIINEYSTADDQKALLDAFAEKGSEGLVNAVEKMSSKGRIRITGTLGFDVNYIREFKMADGSRKIRFVTDRPIAFAESWGSTRSMDYSLSMGEIIISKEKGKSTGTLMPAAKLKLNKEEGLEIEALQNPWNLANIKVWK
ncbi:MAG TPA: hypothetical protein PLL77_10285 [Pyrinomonadaceae bacterium]|nr:hypothetical protein [Pyrinomonadaceae bacterium]